MLISSLGPQLFDLISYRLQLFLQLSGHGFQIASLIFRRRLAEGLISIAYTIARSPATPGLIIS